MAAQMAAPAARYRGLTYSSCPYSKRRLATVPEPSQTPCHGRGSVVPMSGGVERNDWRPVGTWTVAVYRPRSHPDPTALVPARGASADCDHAVSYSANPAGPRNRPANTATHPAPTGHRLLPALQIDRTYSQLGVVGHGDRGEPRATAGCSCDTLEAVTSSWRLRRRVISSSWGIVSPVQACRSDSRIALPLRQSGRV
jgi:hypothetical protein